jgi:hypothetical protein
MTIEVSGKQADGKTRAEISELPLMRPIMAQRSGVQAALWHPPSIRLI